MKTTNTTYRNIRTLALIGIVGAFAMPSTSSATTPESGSSDPQPATGCNEAAGLTLQIDVATGDLYLVDGAGNPTLTDDDHDVYFGTLSSVLVQLQFTSGEWDVVITPSDGPAQTRRTSGGVLSYWITADPSLFTFSSSAATGVSTMMDMTPVVPVVKVRPRPNCPPPT